MACAGKAAAWLPHSKVRVIFSLLFMLALMRQAAAAEERAALPNIIYILADDLGIGDLKSFNPDSKIPTPNLDKLAARGRIFTDAHSASAVCTPTRYGILTGRYPWRSPMKRGVLTGYSGPLIPRERMTVASFLKQQGYYTACVGKWHLGWDWKTKDGARSGVEKSAPTVAAKDIEYDQPIQNGPCELGFDEFFGIPASLDMPPYVFVDRDRATEPPTNTIEDRPVPGFFRGGPISPGFRHEDVNLKFTDRAVKIIAEHAANRANQRLFLYLPLASPHTPILPREQFRGMSKLGPYGDFVCEVDWTVGQILDALDRAGMTQNSLVMFTSDNGFAPYADLEGLKKQGHSPSGPYRGAKADLFEGGHRIPFIARWPGVVPAGTSCTDLISLNDLLATVGDILGQKLPDDAGEDSVSILPALKDSKRTSRVALVHQSSYGSLAIRRENWKLLLCKDSGGWSHPTFDEARKMDLPPVQLYDLSVDIAEQHNVADQKPEVVRQLKDLLKGYLENGRSTPGAKQSNDGVELEISALK